MKFDQHNFAFVTTALTESVVDRMQEVVQIKNALSRVFAENNYRYAIVGEDITSNDLRISYVINLIISVVPHENGTVKLIDECHEISNLMANTIGTLGYRCMIADEDMMGDVAKEKIIFVPKDDEYESFAKMMQDDKTSAPHWIFSGDEDDCDGYYINCSGCVRGSCCNRRNTENQFSVAGCCSCNGNCICSGGSECTCT